MEWIIVVFYIILYFAIGGFINGLSGFKFDTVPVFFWPLTLVMILFMYICDVAEDLGERVRDFFISRKESEK